MVAFDGGIAQLTPPVRVSIIPPAAARHAVIQAFEDDNQDEVVHVVWSERTNAAGDPSPGPPCPSAELLHVRWVLSGTRDFGCNWGCWPSQPGGNCAPQSWLVTEDPSWRPCVGASFSGDETAPSWGVNTDRPEFAMNRGVPYVWYLALNRSMPGESGMRVIVLRQVFGESWETVFVSPPTDPTTGAPTVSAPWRRPRRGGEPPLRGSSARPSSLPSGWQ